MKKEIAEHKKISERLYVASMGEDAVKLAREYGTGLELDHFCSAANMEDSLFADTDAQIRRDIEESGAVRRLLHAPYNELFPAAIDPLALELAHKRYGRAYELALHYGAQALIAHSGYIPFVYFKSFHVERSVHFWTSFMENRDENVMLLIENVLEDEPGMLKELMDSIADRERERKKCCRCGVCLDIGHVLCMSEVSVFEWIETLGGYIKHVHLHNNNGKGDSHDTFDAEGSKADMEQVITAVERYAAADVTYTIESKAPASSLKWLADRGYI